MTTDAYPIAADCRLTHNPCPPGDQCPHCVAGCPVVPEGVRDWDPGSLFELDEEVRRTLPPRFHRPEFDGLGRPQMWLCAVCWGDGTTTQWPCHVAAAHGVQVAKALGVGWSS